MYSLLQRKELIFKPQTAELFTSLIYLQNCFKRRETHKGACEKRPVKPQVGFLDGGRSISGTLVLARAHARVTLAIDC